jgi:hypothetical protein
VIYTVAIDPGKWVSGVCVLDPRARVVSATEPRNPSSLGSPGAMGRAIVDAARIVLGAHRPDVVRWVAEYPQSYPGDHAPEADLALLREVVRAVELEARRPVERVKPRTWKGNVPKAVHHTRILRALEAHERERIEDGKEALDALGLALWAVGRTGRGGVSS